MSDHRNTLLLPFEKGLLPLPSEGAKWAMLNALVLPVTDFNWASILHCEQGFRSDYNSLQAAGFSVEAEISQLKNFDGVFVFANRSRKVNENNLTRAWNGLKTGGILVFSGTNTSGAKPLRKWAGKRTEIAGSLSKHHAVAFWLIKQGEDWAVEPPQAMQEGYHVAHGMFSASGPDKGSRLLAEYFSEIPHGGVRGRVADFGAGWGFLSAELMKGPNKVEKLELFEADWESLQAAKLNVGGEVEFHWCDLIHEPPRGPYNWIIMNPPFHTGRAAEPKLGTIFIEAAAKSLPSGGRLLLVANTNLPYENILNNLFKKVEKKVQANGFKVIEAVR